MNIVITGAGKGIGFELVKILSSDQRHQLIGISRNVTSLNGLSPNVLGVSCDLSQLPSSELLQAINGPFNGRVDVLVNNAGLLINRPYSQISLADFEAMMSINLKAPHLLIQMLLPFFPKGAHVVNISSMGGFPGSVKFPGLALYSTFKGALCALTECLAVELRESGVAVNALCLGAVQTEMFQKAFPGAKAPVSPFEMADFISFFALNGAKYFNGKVIPVSLSTP